LICRDLLTDDGSLWIVIGDTRRNYAKLLLPHRLALKLIEKGKYIFREDIVWYKKNNISSSSNINFSQAYELVLFFSKNERCFTNLDDVRTKGNEVMNRKSRLPDPDKIQYKASKKDKSQIIKIQEIIHNAKSTTPITDLPTTSQIASAYGYNPEKHCPTCHRKFKRHATRKRVGDHRHYPIFAVCNSRGKNPGNVWEIATKAHHGNEHFAIFPEDLVARIINFTTQKGDWVLDPFVGRGTTGIVCANLGRNFFGIDLYSRNAVSSKRNIASAVLKKKIESTKEKSLD
jgi:DNA modification methylase